jgi:hypothetical protein
MVRFSMPVTARNSFISGACLLVPSLLLVAGCAAVPNLGAKPEPLAPAAIAASKSLPGTSDAQWPVEGWWRAYGDQQRDALIAEAPFGPADDNRSGRNKGDEAKRRQ